MRKRWLSKALLGLAVAAVAVTSLGATAASADPDPVRSYSVTIRNLTTGQFFAPVVFATHDADVEAFRVGRPASEGLRLVAETGSNAMLAQEWSATDGVYGVFATQLPLRRIGGAGPDGSASTSTYRIDALAGQELSLAGMLACTNDGFVGAAGLALPEGFAPVRYTANGYDAGTERNTERSADLGDLCGVLGPKTLPADGNARVPTTDFIAPHPGVRAIADLSLDHDWPDPVMEITIQRVK